MELNVNAVLLLKTVSLIHTLAVFLHQDIQMDLVSHS